MNSLTRWNPVRDLLSVHDEVNRAFSDAFGRRFFSDEPGTVVWQPPLDIEEQPDRYVVRVELPGMKLEDIKITLEDGQLVIRGQKVRTEERKGTTYHRLERVYGTFERTFHLTHAVKSDTIEATYRDGVLELNLPKAEEAKAREIPIKIAQ